MRANPRRLLAVVLRDAVFVVAVLISTGIVLRATDVIDHSFIFFPDRDVFNTPADVGLSYEDVDFQAADGTKLHGWLVPSDGDVTLVWFHGNAGNISHRVANLAALRARIGATIFIFNYRGYGRSEGSPSEDGTYLDAESALDYLASRADLEGSKTVLFGRSLGAAVAAEMAIRRPARALVLESGFTSIPDMARRHYPFLPGIGKLTATKYDTLSKIGRVEIPTMVLHGDRDEIASFEMGRQLYEAANDPKRFYTIPGAGHNETYEVGDALYYDALAGFIDEFAGGD